MLISIEGGLVVKASDNYIFTKFNLSLIQSKTSYEFNISNHRVYLLSVIPSIQQSEFVPLSEAQPLY